MSLHLKAASTTTRCRNTARKRSISSVNNCDHRPTNANPSRHSSGNPTNSSNNKGTTIKKAYRSRSGTTCTVTSMYTTNTRTSKSLWYLWLLLLLLGVPFAESLHDAWIACSSLAEPGTPIAEVVQSMAAAALKQRSPKQQNQQVDSQEEQQQEQVRQHLELCLGVGWVAACARDVTGSFAALGTEGKRRLFQICHPTGELPLQNPIRCYRLLADWGLNRPGVPHHDTCTSWTDANTAQQKDSVSSVASLAAAYTLMALILLETLARLLCFKARRRYLEKSGGA